MNLIETLQNGVVNLHNSEGYFTTLPACECIYDGQKERLSKTLHATGLALQDALDKVGVIALVTSVGITRFNEHFALARLSVLYIENLALNRSPNGTGKTARDMGMKGWAICEGQQIAPWAPLQFEAFEEAGGGHEGLEAWELKLQTTTLYDNVSNSILSQDGGQILTSDGTPLIIHPTDP